MSLGNAFPAGFARIQIERQLQPGVVVKFLARMDDGKIHEKRFVILDVSETSFTCVINSQISPLLSRNPNSAMCQVAMELASHSFMERDSHVDCSRVRTYETADVLNQLCDEPAWVLGSITKDLRDEIMAALKAAKTVPVALVKQCCDSLQSAEL